MPLSTLYDLVSRGTNTSGSNQCYGDYDSSTGTGTGAGYTNNCIHSGTIANVDANTVWYNYGVASAGTITGTSNTTTATQSICPKGWTLPNTTQLNSIGSIDGGTGADSGSDIYVSSFSPVLGGYYVYGTLHDESTYGVWWGSTASNGALRYGLGYNGSSLYTGNGNDRNTGHYVRCVQAS